MADLCQTCKDWRENGDGSQLICDICHGSEEEIDFPADIDVDDVNNVEFPDDADDANDEDEINTIPWREVPLMKWQRIINTLPINTIHGTALILKLQTSKGAIYQAWATKVITQKIIVKEKEKGNKNLFIKSMGKKDCKYSKNFYYDFRCKIM